MSQVITEGIAGSYFYHLSNPAKSMTKSLCGRPVMHTSIPLSAWGHVGHLNERWCKECAKKLPGRKP